MRTALGGEKQGKSFRVEECQSKERPTSRADPSSRKASAWDSRALSRRDRSKRDFALRGLRSDDGYGFRWWKAQKRGPRNRTASKLQTMVGWRFAKEKLT